jgi:hypothetical protein
LQVRGLFSEEGKVGAEEAGISNRAAMTFREGENEKERQTFS